MKNTKTVRLAQYAVLVAVMLLMGFTPIGYIRIGVIEISTMMLPVAIAGIVMGPMAGTLLGSVFGITSLIQCFTGSAFGAFLFGLNPFLTVIICIVPRMLMGYLVGVIFKALNKIDRTRIISFAVASISSALLNTIFFIGFLLIFFWGNNDFISQMTTWGMNTDGIFVFFAAFVGVNGIAEAIFALVAGTAISKPLYAGFSDKKQ